MLNHQDKILTISDKKEERFLRKKTEDFDFQKFGHQEISQLINKMKKIMHQANGIGLSANQIGLNFKMFVAQIPGSQGSSKFYALFNPRIEKVDSRKESVEEGCLSVPGFYGQVTRLEKLALSGFDKNGKPLRIKAWGLLARVFQHEVDHLNGILFIDHTKQVYSFPKSERLQKK